MDSNQNGTISLDEFLEMMSRRMNEYRNKKEICETFRAFDKENTGYIVAAELRVPSMSFYPDFIQIFLKNSLYPNFIQILS